MDSRIRVGRYLLLNGGTLAKVRTIDLNGFDFLCINGAWEARYSFADKMVTIDGLEPSEGEITCYDQPPKEIEQSGYNAMIAWMRLQAGTGNDSDRQTLKIDAPAVALPKTSWRPFANRADEQEFTVTCTETHSATYKVHASTREEAYRKWQNLDWSDATDRHLSESSDVTVVEA